MRILITGSDGFIGEHSVREAERRGHVVTRLDEKGNFVDPNVNYTSFDKLSADKLNSTFDAIIHLAAYIDIAESFEQPWTYVDNNINTLKNFMGYTGRFVFASSYAVYADRDSPYSLTKKLGEFLLPSNSISLRISNTFGLGDGNAHIIPILARHAMRNTTATLYNGGTQTRQFVWVEDVARALVLAAESEYNNPVDVVGQEMSITEVASLMGVRYDEVYSPRDTADVQTLRPPIDHTKSGEHIGWRPLVDSKDKIRDWRDWF